MHGQFLLCRAVSCVRSYAPIPALGHQLLEQHRGLGTLHPSKGTPGLWMVTQGWQWLEEALMRSQGCSKSCAGFTADSLVTLIRDCGFQEL